MQEIWKSIRNYEGLYKISSFGRVINIAKQKVKILKHGLNGRGYLIVSLWKDNKGKTFRIHRLVADHFILNEYNKSCVNHKNGVKIDNCVNNLEWCTYSENNKHAFDIGLNRSNNGEKNGKAKLTKENVLQIRNSDLSCKELMKIFEISQATVSDIKTYKTWKHL